MVDGLTAPRSTRWVTLLVVGWAAVVCLGFAVVVYGYVFSNGLCCGDDSYIAGAAKNLAFGNGYATSVPIDGYDGVRLFDPLVSTGPALVLPAALLIMVFGATPWAPGLATALVCTAVVAMLWRLLARHTGLVRAAAFVGVMVAVQYTLTAGPRFAQWYALLGEAPAALLTVLGAAVLAFGGRSRRSIVLGFLAVGLAVMAKTLALLGVIPLVVWLLVPIVAHRGRRGRDWVDLAVAASVGAAPIVAFELWKLLTLGWAGYTQNVRDFLAFFTVVGGDPAATEQVGLVTTALVNSSVLRDAFGFGAGLLAVTMIAVCALAVTSTDRPTATFVVLTAGSGATHLAYFLAASNGNARYALIGLLLLAAAAAGTVFAEPSRRAVLGATAVMIAAMLAGLPRLVDPIRYTIDNGFRPNQRVQNLEAAADVLAGLDRDEPLVGSWWATVADLDYMLPTGPNFERVEGFDADESRAGRILARNEIFVDLAASPEFRAWEEHCDEVLFSAGPYRVSACPADG